MLVKIVFMLIIGIFGSPADSVQCGNTHIDNVDRVVTIGDVYLVSFNFDQVTLNFEHGDQCVAYGADFERIDY